jgi:hypothetical protein
MNFSQVEEEELREVPLIGFVSELNSFVNFIFKDSVCKTIRWTLTKFVFLIEHFLFSKLNYICKFLTHRREKSIKMLSLSLIILIL